MRLVLLRLLFVVALPLVLVTVWWLASDESTDVFWPPLRTILTTFPDVWTAERLRADVLPSLLRLSAGYALAAVAGIALGTVIGSYRRVRAVCEPVLEFLRAVPPPVLVPVIMLFAGIGDTMKIVVIASGCVWPVLLNTVEGVRAVDSVLSETARSYGITGVARLRNVVLRSASPQIFAGLRQALSIGIILMVISEMTASSNGLGHTIVQFQRGFAIPDMWTGILVLGLLGFLLSVVFRLVERRVLGWYHGLRASSRRSW
ncbi:ABC transporter permease [Streptomyces europaeiscabiei]|uniref:ABC transporter permease subunit n=1 Tax=Streptomyces europaeiscabiei TaxID=146819 RepID=A0ABU4N621_9ACTN|nr:ABC transporter permease subunit [Streptomyces europaeiscabiei]MDX2527148.1 ABC transporter permease subunit [Streptomyces europaeiscabiei]MDX2761634.1 ABC transporter permease subunit [Streptomyces europaeiscabiei]MDX2767466.1 ABC transporter permease subunit [Streptomyces europaeiscabiei]MDX3542206.1 ABC transporter permease subunit [Streptomyces europaeiscabiei]MDX3551254.1 ABC transporter permease subunit [Streptomyces europaeiscabiei]